MRKKFRRIATAAICLSLGGLGAEPIEIAIEQQTVLGQSVFVTGPLPGLGSEVVTQSLKLSPHDYPVWKLTIDLPPGVSFEPTFLIRNDAPATLPDPGNGQTISTSQLIQTGPDPLAKPQPIRIYTDSTVDAITATISADSPGFTPIDLALMRSDLASGDREFSIVVSQDHIANGRLIQFDLGTSKLPPGNPVRLHGAPVYWRHGQAFLHPPPDSSPASPRVETFTFAPAGGSFRSRTIRVQLPRGYDQNPDRNYPVLYAQDGQNVFSPGGPFGSWDLDLIIPDLTRRGEIPEIILVGIDNSQNRIIEYIPEYITYSGQSGRGGEFLSMIRDELMPEIESRYRVATGPENTAHIGSSLGGVLGFVAAHDFDDTFGTVIAMSSSFWLDVDEFITRATDPANLRARLWIDSGTAGTSNDSYPECIAVRDAMVADGQVLGRDFWHTVGLGQQHNEAAWRTRSPAALRWAFAPTPERLPLGGTRWLVTSATPAPEARRLPNASPPKRF